MKKTKLKWYTIYCGRVLYETETGEIIDRIDIRPEDGIASWSYGGSFLTAEQAMAAVQKLYSEFQDRFEIEAE